MTKSLKMRGYRAFENFEIDDLARVNLLVGKNGCGKTSILEAIQILATQNPLTVLRGIAYKRGEAFVKENPETKDRVFLPLLNHFFHGRELVPGRSFEIAGDSSIEKVRAEICDLNDQAAPRRSFEQFQDFVAHYLLEIAGSVYSITENGAIIDGTPPRKRGSGKATPPVQFVQAESLKIDQMSKMWDQVLIDSQESDVIDAMRILDPAFENVFFLSDYPARGSHGSVLLSFGDDRGRVPLGSTGEGMRRLLSLALALTQARGGVLLVDEIDTGLHYSVLGQMWLLIVEAARKMDIQVFATTHSLDCVKGLAWLCENHPELREEVALHKIDESLDHSVAFDAEQIAIADEQGIEVR